MSNNSHQTESKKSSRKTIVIGLDGATLDLFGPWARQGRLPNFAKIMEGGVSGTLISTVPPFTAPAWVSIFTGMNPGKHGIFGFTRLNAQTKKKEMVNSQSIGCNKIWHILNKYGKSTGMINIPMTYPPEKVDGFMVTGMMTPSKTNEYTYPESLAKEMEREIGEYIIDIPVSYIHHRDNKEILKRIVNTLKVRERALHLLMDKYPSDFLMAVFIAPDRIQHLFWKYLVPHNKLYSSEKGKAFRDEIEKCYQQLDEIIGRIINQVDSDTTVFIVSDHGFGQWRKSVYLNNWLSDSGLLTPAKSRGVLRKVVRGVGLLGIKRLIPAGTINRVGQTSSDRMINWSKTRAYTADPFNQGINMNLEGREPGGIVKHGKEYEDLRDYLIDRLYLLEDTDTGEKIVEKVWKKEEVYWGPFLPLAPKPILSYSAIFSAHFISIL